MSVPLSLLTTKYSRPTESEKEREGGREGKRKLYY